MLKSFLSALGRTFKSRLGIAGAVITLGGAVGHILEANKVNAWVCVAGLGLFAIAAQWELARSHASTVSKEGELTAATKRAWHFGQERDHYRQLVTELEQRWIFQQPRATGLSGGDVNQRAFRFDDPHQLVLSPLPEGHRMQGVPRDDVSAGVQGRGIPPPRSEDWSRRKVDARPFRSNPQVPS